MQGVFNFPRKRLLRLMGDILFSKLPLTTATLLRPRIVPNAANCADAFLAGFLPGPDGGQAIAEVRWVNGNFALFILDFK